MGELSCDASEYKLGTSRPSQHVRRSISRGAFAEVFCICMLEMESFAVSFGWLANYLCNHI